MRPSKLSAITAALLGAAASIGACNKLSDADRADPSGPASVDQRIDFHERQVAAAPRLYPALVELGAAYLDKAAVTHDPAWLAKTRSTLERALALQPSYESFLLALRLANHTHRFAEALRWGQRAAAASVNGALAPDPILVPALLEAHLGLGQAGEARDLLPPDGQLPANHHLAVAQGHWMAAHQRTDEAVVAFRRAAELAGTERDLVAWSLVRAAGALLDSGRAPEAAPLLEQARRQDPQSTLLRLHEAELAAARGELRTALATYDSVLASEPSPDVHAAAFRLATRIQDAALARTHFHAAEAGYRRALAAGEVYTLGGLAELYLAAGVNLAEALTLAERNLQYRQDPQAHALLATLRARLSEAGADTARL